MPHLQAENVQNVQKCVLAKTFQVPVVEHLRYFDN